MINLDLFMATPETIRKNIGKNAKRKRKEMGYTQETLAEMTGMSLASLRRFEQTGHISLDSLIAVAISLDSIKELEELFTKRTFKNIKELLDYEERQRS